MSKELKRLSGLPVVQLARELHSLRRKVRDLEGTQREWAAVIAHDMRLPLVAIEHSEELLGKVSSQDEEAARARRRISEATRMLHRMVDELTDVSIIESGRLEIRCEEGIRLSPLVHGIVDALTAVLPAHRVLVEVPADLPFVEADPGRIAQILGNLLTNAGKYGKVGTPIRIDATPKERVVEIGVTSEGATLAPDQIPRLFSRFYRAPTQGGSAIEGLGLGLYIAKRLVESHGGTIWATSQNGVTSFRFTLPQSG